MKRDRRPRIALGLAKMRIVGKNDVLVVYVEICDQRIHHKVDLYDVKVDPLLSRTFRVILFSIYSDEWKSFQSQHQTALRRSKHYATTATAPPPSTPRRHHHLPAISSPPHYRFTTTIASSPPPSSRHHYPHPADSNMMCLVVKTAPQGAFGSGFRFKARLDCYNSKGAVGLTCLAPLRVTAVGPFGLVELSKGVFGWLLTA
nr:hypothetical protein [Tanacetum cinerariifolium]